MQETTKPARLTFGQFKKLPEEQRKAIIRESGLDQAFARLQQVIAERADKVQNVLREANSPRYNNLDLKWLEAVAVQRLGWTAEQFWESDMGFAELLDHLEACPRLQWPEKTALSKSSGRSGKREKHPRGYLIDGEKLKGLRARCSWKQHTLAEMAGLSPDSIHRGETGQALDLSTIEAIARAFSARLGDQISSSDLISSQKNRNRPQLA